MIETIPRLAVADFVAEQLSAFPQLAGLPRRTLEILTSAGRPRPLHPEEPILEQGVPCPSVFIVLRGRLKMTRALADGRSALLAIYSPGDPVGISVLGGRESHGTVAALEQSVCLDIPRQELLAAMAADPQVLGDLLAVFTERATECRHCWIESASTRVEQRFARLFLKLGDSVGRSHGEGVFVPVPLSRKDLASMAGTTIETTIRIMSRWRRDAIVDTLNNGFLVRDPQTLAALSDS